MEASGTVFRFNIKLEDDEVTVSKILATNIDNMEDTDVDAEASLEGPRHALMSFKTVAFMFHFYVTI